ncbi:two-component system response regulator [Ligilactobacillus murinus]|nr:response regulator transcription factor [Ligilactobacillus murinus]BDI00910.1 two-component system response regulator [Ligilactobacillus murinus]GFI62887.1 accessory gene regulator A [Lactobacillaceae bacterium]
MFNFYILDDDRTQQILLEKILHKLAEELHLSHINIEAFSKAIDLKNNILLPSPQNIYILDLELQGDKHAGLKVGKYIRQNDPYASIIFLTVHEDFLSVTYSYRIEALNFIAKNNNDRLYDTLKLDIEQVIRKQARWSFPSENILSLKTSTGVFRIPLADISYFTTSSKGAHSSFLFTKDNRQYRINLKLGDIEKNYPNIFLKPHRSYLVNPHAIESINYKEHYLVLLGHTHTKINIARGRYRSFLKEFAKYNI